jgi:hypothetical protein
MVLSGGQGVDEPTSYVYDGFDRRDRSTVEVATPQDYAYVGTVGPRVGPLSLRTDRVAVPDRLGHDRGGDQLMPMIEIWDGPAVQFGDLLDAIRGADELSWSVMEFWGVARDDETDLVAIERGAAESPTGLTLSATELREFAAQLLQLIDGIVVGYRQDPPTRSDADLRTSSEVVIEAIDSTLWRVWARDRAIVDRLHCSYDDVRNVEPEVALPPVHEES